MTILFITTNWRETGGDWTFTKEYIEIFEKKGHKVIPFAMNHEKNLPSKFSADFISKVDYSELNHNKSISNGLKVLRKSIYSTESRKKLKRILNKFHIDIVQVLNIHNTHTLSILPEIHRRKIPIIWRVIDYKILCPNRSFLANNNICEACFGDKYYQPFLKKCKKQTRLASLIVSIEAYFNHYKNYYELVDFFSLQSNFSYDMFKKYGYTENKLGVKGNPFRRSNKASISSKNQNNNSILYVGRLSSEKGLLTLLEAMERIPHIQLNIVGNGPQRNELNNLIQQKNLTNIKLLGGVWGEQLLTIFQSSLMLVVPSEWYEPNPYVVLQAYDNHLPVIGSDIGGLPDMIINNKTGLLFQMGNSLELSEKIELLYNDSKLRRELGKKANDFLKNFEPELFYEYHINLYQRILNEK